MEQNEVIVNNDGKFMTIFTPANLMYVKEVKYKTSKMYGNTLQINIGIHTEQFNQATFIIKTNSHYKKEYKEKYDKSPSDVIGLLADYLGMKHIEFRDIIKRNSQPATQILDQKFAELQTRICKIDCTVIPQGGINTKIFGVNFENKEFQTFLKQKHMHWEKEEKCWKGQITQEEIEEINNKPNFDSIRIITEPTKFVSSSNETIYKVFNLATQQHVTVPFNQIRSVIVNEIGKEIEKLEEPPISFASFSGLSDNKIYEYVAKGEPVWVIKTLAETVNGESLVGYIQIQSGNNTKRASIKVISLIKVGGCDNSVRKAIEEAIYHKERWESKLITALHSYQNILENTVDLIETAMNTTISKEEALEYLSKLNFGLKDQDKIEILRGLLIQRLVHEYDEKMTKWSVSQTLTYVGSHSNEYQKTFDSLELSDTMISTLQDLGYEALLIN